MFQIKRIYDRPDQHDGYRVLVDRLWPRGVAKVRAHLDLWLKQVAPSPQLRTWWNHDPERLAEFASKYRAELDANPAVDELRQLGRERRTVTLLYAARDPQVNHAAVLRDYLRQGIGNASHGTLPHRHPDTTADAVTDTNPKRS